MIFRKAFFNGGFFDKGFYDGILIRKAFLTDDFFGSFFMTGYYFKFSVTKKRENASFREMVAKASQIDRKKVENASFRFLRHILTLRFFYFFGSSLCPQTFRTLAASEFRMLPTTTPPTSPTPPMPVVFVCVDDDADAATVAAAVVSAADAHYEEVDRIAAQAEAAAEHESLAAAIAKADAAANALIAEEEVEASIKRERNLANKLAADAKAKLAAHKRTVALVHKRAVAAAESARAQQQLREAADRDSQRDRKLREQRKAAALLPVPHVLPSNSPDRRVSSRFTELFARKKAAADAAFLHGYALYMSRFSLVPVPATDALLFGEFDEATQQLTSCPQPARCSLCCERRATHMYVPCGHVCVCRDCAAASPWVCMTCDVPPDMVLLLHGMPK